MANKEGIRLFRTGASRQGRRRRQLYFSNAAYGENVFKIGIVQNGPAQVFGIDCLDNAVFEELFQVDGYDVGAMYQRVQIRVPEGVGRSGFGQGTNGAQPAGERIFKILHDAGRVFRPG